MSVKGVARGLWRRVRSGVARLLGRSPAPQAQPQQPTTTASTRSYIPIQPRVLSIPAAKPRTSKPVVAATSRSEQVRVRLPLRQRIGNRLGEGGQGAVHELDDDPTRVVKQFARAIPGVEKEFQQLVDAGPRIARPLAGLPIALCWPEEAMIDNGLAGYSMPRLDSCFYFEHSGKYKLRTLDWAVPKPRAFTLPFTVTDADRLTLVQLIAAVLESMHNAGVVYGDLSWANFSFDTDSGVHLAVYDVDSSRVLGTRSFTRQPPAKTPDWDDPTVPNLPVATLDADRYKFALLAFRMLVSRNFDGRIAPAQIAAPVPGLSDDAFRQLKSLWTRASGSEGTRPQLSEWTRILGRTATP